VKPLSDGFWRAVTSFQQNISDVGGDNHDNSVAIMTQLLVRLMT